MILSIEQDVQNVVIFAASSCYFSVFLWPILSEFTSPEIMLINYQELSEQALHGVVQQFVLSQLSESDDKIDVEQWVSEAIRAVKNGELVIEFSEVDQSVYLKRKEEVALTDGAESTDSHRQS